jgi:DNA-binding NtrC family response regulator
MTRILVVDDDPSVCQSIRIVLRRNGYHVVTADGAEAGLELLDSTAFDLLIVDVCMPQMHGFESIRIFHHRAPQIPLVAISGYAFADSGDDTPNFLSMAIELGAWRCMRKPFMSAALLYVVKECLEEARLGTHPTSNRQSQAPATSMKVRTLADSKRDVG